MVVTITAILSNPMQIPLLFKEQSYNFRASCKSVVAQFPSCLIKMTGISAIMTTGLSSHRDFQPIRCADNHETARTDRDSVPQFVRAADHVGGPGVTSATSAQTGSARPDDGYHTVQSALNQLESAVYGVLERESGSRGISPRLVHQARRHYAMRRRRDIWVKDMFGEPAWDMLLELFIAAADGRATPVKNLCLAACTSVSTALRRLECLLDSGLVNKVNDDTDARRSLITLTDRGLNVMTMLLHYETYDRAPSDGLSSAAEHAGKPVP